MGRGWHVAFELKDRERVARSGWAGGNEGGLIININERMLRRGLSERCAWEDIID